MAHTHVLYSAGMLSNGSDHPSQQPACNTGFGGAPPAPDGVNGYPGYNYGPPPPAANNYGYYNNNHPLAQSAPPAHAPHHHHQLHGYNNYYAPQPQPQPPSNYGYYNNDRPTSQPIARRPKAKNGRIGKSSNNSESYTVSGNRVSGNKGDHNGVFNIGNKHRRRGMDDEEEEEEED